MFDLKRKKHYNISVMKFTVSRKKAKGEDMAKIKIKKGFVLNEIDSEYIVAATGRRSRTFGGYICLNHTGKFLWDIISKGTEKDTLYKKFAEEFGIDYTTAKEDADAFLSRLEGADIIER